jgi:GAF domain-containing protein/sugar diacid utilization regulator
MRSSIRAQVNATDTTHTIDRRFLYEIISTVSSSLELDRVLAAVVRLLSDASAVHACFVYLLEDGGNRLVLRAASEPYSHLAGKVALERGEGLAWSAVERREPAFIREGAQADPRFKYVAEIDEDRFQSLVCVPMPGRDGAPIGTITLHTEAPREFSESEVEFLVSSGALVAGAVENARVYAGARRRVSELEHLAELSEAAARASALEELLPVVAERTRALLEARACHVYLADAGDEALQLRASSPEEASSTVRQAIPMSEVGPELARSGRDFALAVPLVVNETLLGVLTAQGSDAVDLARAAANQIGVAIKKIEVIEELLEKNLIRDFLESLASRHTTAAAVSRAERLGCDLEREHLVLFAGGGDERLERRLKALVPGAVVDRHADVVHALLPVGSGGAARRLAEVRKLHDALGDGPPVGLSNPCAGATAFPGAFEEARYALVGATVLGDGPTVTSYEELGVYQYLLRMAIDPGMRDSQRDALGRLQAYDAEHGTALLETLEHYLLRRGNISATSLGLYIHPNTLRQRLRRISELTGIDLARDDWLMLELALKLLKLQRVLGEDAHMPDLRGM